MPDMATGPFSISVRTSRGGDAVEIHLKPGGSDRWYGGQMLASWPPAGEFQTVAETDLDLPEGRHTLFALATREFTVPGKYQGTCGCSHTATDRQEIVVDKTPPVVSAVEIRAEQHGMVVTGIVTDSMTGVEAVYVSGFRAAIGPSGSFTATIPVDTIIGETVEVKAVDGASLSARSQTLDAVYPAARWEQRSQDYWELLGMYTRPGYRPQGGPLGYGYNVVWLRFEDGVMVERLETPKWVYQVPLAIVIVLITATLLLLFMKMSAVALRFIKWLNRGTRLLNQALDKAEGLLKGQPVHPQLPATKPSMGLPAPPTPGETRRLLARFAGRHPAEGQALWLAVKAGNPVCLTWDAFLQALQAFASVGQNEAAAAMFLKFMERESELAWLQAQIAKE
jgi:hypothetical protein